MKPSIVFATLALLSGTAFAESDDKVFLEQFQSTFEGEQALEVKDFLPAEYLRGTLHSVRPLCGHDGMNNIYFVEALGGVEAITGTAALKQYIRELYALDHLRGLKKSEEFGKALAKSAEAKLESVAGIVRDPIGTIKSVPKGASRFFGRIGEGMKGGKSEEESASPLAGITGVNKAKVQLAVKLGVNPYTTNVELQRELTETAQAMAGGGLLVNVGTALVSGGAGAALSVVGVNQTLQDTLVNSTPEDLRIINRKKLFALGLNRSQADEFLMHPWYSPWHETIITESLTAIGANPADFLSRACEALTPEDAYYFQRIAQVLATYRATKAPLLSVRLENGVICALDSNNVLVIPLSCDYAIWAERSARRAEEFAAFGKANPSITGLALWVDGKVSDRAAQELAKRNIEVKLQVLPSDSGL